MPLNAYGWTTEEDEILAELVRPHSVLYSSVNDPSRKSILAREAAWGQIAQSFVNKPAEECKKRWRGIRDSYMRSKRVGSVHRTKVGVFGKLEEFLTGVEMEPGSEEATSDTNEDTVPEPEISLVEDEELINQTGDEGIQLTNGSDTKEFFEINSETVTLIETPMINDTGYRKNVIKILPKPPDMTQMGALQQTAELKAPAIIKGRRRKRNLPPPTNTVPVKILPNPMNPIILKPFQYQEQQNTAAGSSENRSQLIDTIIEKILKESTNEVDVFFKSMAEAVKKMHPGLVPKVKMEVCNVVAKYEMQSIFKKC